MNGWRSTQYLRGLLHELRALPRETEWVEFKENRADPQEIGEYLSALANSAALAGKAEAYLVWGVRDGDHAVVGTSFDPAQAKKGGEDLENWLLRLLEPKIDFRFFRLDTDDGPVIVTEIARAARQPVRFAGREYIRVGSYKKNLGEFPERERALWRIFDQVPFEDGVAAQRASGEEVLLALDYPTYFHLLGMPLPDGRAAILDALRQDGLIAPCAAGGFDVTNLGAILFARDLGAFPRLGRKAVRVIEYRGRGRTEGVGEREYAQGYAPTFQTMVDYVNGKLPTREVIGDAFRRTLADYPPLAVRELVANALLHQDFSVNRRGADGRDLRRPDRDHESGRAAGGCAALPRPTPGVAQRSADVAHAPARHLRGARRRHRQGGRGARVPATAGAADRGAARRDPRGAVRPEAARRHGPVGTRARLLPARMSEVRGAGFSDQRVAARPLRGPVEQQGDGVALHPRGGRRGRDPAARRTGSAQDAPLRPVLGRRGSGR